MNQPSSDLIRVGGCFEKLKRRLPWVSTTTWHCMSEHLERGWWGWQGVSPWDSTTVGGCQWWWVGGSRWWCFGGCLQGWHGGISWVWKRFLLNHQESHKYDEWSGEDWLMACKSMLAGLYDSSNYRKLCNQTIFKSDKKIFNSSLWPQALLTTSFITSQLLNT